VDAVPESLSLHALVGRIVQQPVPLPVVDAQQRYIGAVTQTMVLQKMLDLDTEE
jgi:ABC-type proline/glycine betaine transport system ATPase subunit